jgi:hypothetical protein
MDSVRFTFELIVISYALLSGLSFWILVTGGPRADGPRKTYSREERIQKARAALAMGTVFIWSAVGACTIVWLACWIVVKLIQP